MINISSVSNVNTRIRLTKKGNPYIKTRTGRLAGTGIGLAGGSAFLIFSKEAKQRFQALEKAAIDKGNSANIAKIGGALGGIVLAALAGFGIGSVVDFAINKFRAHNADKYGNK